MIDKKLVFHNSFPNRKALSDDPKVRRLQFMLTRYLKPKCEVCRDLAHYILARSKNAWCRSHLPPKFKRKLDLDYQMAQVIPYAEHLDWNK